MKRMIDNKDYESLKNNVNEISDIVEEHTTDYVIKSVVYEDEEVKGFQIEDVENEITYNIVLGGGGKQLYQHNIEIAFHSGNGDNWQGNVIFSFINQEANEYTSEADMFSDLYDLLGLNNKIIANGRAYFTSTEGIKVIRSVGFVLYGSSTEFGFDNYKLASTTDFSVYNDSQSTATLVSWTTSFKDNVNPL